MQPTQAKPDGMDLQDWFTGCSYNPAGRKAKKCKMEKRQAPLCLGFLVINAIDPHDVKQYQMFVQPKDTTAGVWKNLVQIFYKNTGSRESGGGVQTYMGINNITILPTGIVGTGLDHTRILNLVHVKKLFRTIMLPANLVTDDTRPHPVKLKYVNFFVTIVQGAQGEDWMATG